MIKVLGIKRVIVLGALCAAAGVLASVNYLYATPERIKVEAQLRSTKAQLHEKTTEADRLNSEFDQINEQKDFYESLQRAGFFSDQNRLVAKRRITDVQERTGLLQAKYDINTGEIIEEEAATDAGYVILSSPITMDLEAMDDIDIYSFIFWFENTMPGHLTINKLNMTRRTELTEASLRQIGSGVPTTLMAANLDFVWRTMVPANTVRKSDDMFDVPGDY